ncbi:hypothetical protein BH24ACT2_BH24ACT2_16930 [soil metagenome]
MVEHGRVLEDGGQAGAVDGGHGQPGEGVGPDQGDGQEGRCQRGEDGGHRNHQIGSGATNRASGRHRHYRQQPRPEQQRAGHAAPQPGQAVGPRGRPGRGLGHVDQAVVAAHQRPRQARQRHRDQNGHAGETTGGGQSRVSSRAGRRTGGEPQARKDHGEGRPGRHRPEQGHVHRRHATPGSPAPRPARGPRVRLPWPDRPSGRSLGCARPPSLLEIAGRVEPAPGEAPPLVDLGRP